MKRHSSAVVLGASMSGLLAARALTNHFDHVTIVERDVLPTAPQLRKGVPQAAHAHGLLTSGFRVIDRYFPGLIEHLSALGAPLGDVVGDFLWFQYGHWKLRHHAGLRGIVVSRPLLETVIRERVGALASVSVLDGTSVVRPAFDPTSGRVTGVVVRTADGGVERTIDAELTVDASGRGSHSPQWLEQWGFGQPASVTVKVNVGYATRTFERRPGEFFNSLGGVIAGTTPGEKRLAAVLAAEGPRWVVTLAGTMGDHPPTDERGWLDFARGLPVSAVHDLVSRCRPLGDIVPFRFPANQRRLYEKMGRFPDGYVVVGDAICSFNPIYGQGMSVAAMEGQTLDEVLGHGLTGLAPRFFARAREIIDIPWTIATGEDLRFPEVDGARPAGFAVMNRYLERLHAVASEDPVVCQKFFDVLNLLAPPPSLMTPGMMWRVLSRRRPHGPGTPWGMLPLSSAPSHATDAASV